MVKLSFMLFKICEKRSPLFLPEAKRKGKKKQIKKVFVRVVIDACDENVCNSV